MNISLTLALTLTFLIIAISISMSVVIQKFILNRKIRKDRNQLAEELAEVKEKVNNLLELKSLTSEAVVQFKKLNKSLNESN